MLRSWLRLSLLFALLAACAPTEAVPTLRPTAPPLAAPLTPVVTVSPMPTPTTRPSATPTATAPPPATFTATAAPSATPVIINPLTGQPVSEAAVLARRPIMVKIAQFPRKVRPDQSGLTLADNVWEHYAEGGATRFTAIFLSNAPERIGNVRSARLLDTYLGVAYAALVVASGSSQGTLDRLRDAGFYERVIAEATGYGGCPVLCREAPADQTSNKLYTSAPAVWALADQLKLGLPPSLAGYTFADEPPAGGAPVTTLHIDFQLNNTVSEWRYNPATGLYDRWVDTANLPELAPQIDHATGQALTAATVVLAFVPYAPSNIREEEHGTVFYSYDVPLVGRGPARIFRDGQMWAGEWVRESDGLPRFLDAAGQPLPFHPGQIWFTPVDPDSPYQLDETRGTFQIRFKVPPPLVATSPPLP